MKVLILGAGAVGGYMGARLIAAGADVVFLARGARLRTLSERGLVIESALGNFADAVTAVSDVSNDARSDLVIVACKAPALDGAMQAVAPGVGAGTRILTVLNGVAHLETVARAFPGNAILGGVAHGALTLREDGTIAHLTPFFSTTFGAVTQAEDPVAEELARHLRKVHVDGGLSRNIRQDMWNKFVFLTTLAGMTCLMRASIGTILSSDDGEELILGLLNEAISVAQAEGHAPDPASLASYRDLLTQRGSTFTASMLRDVQAGRQTEAEHIVGDMLRRARRQGVQTPLLKIVTAHLQCHEAGVRVSGAMTCGPPPLQAPIDPL